MSTRVAVVTTGRADYGLLRPLLAQLARDDRFELQVIATGSHLLESQGMTVKEVQADGYAVISLPLPADEHDSPAATARAIGALVASFAEAIEGEDLDLVVILGDRFEAFAAASASLVMGVPIAHIHGGEITLGSLDDAFRHAITKMATLHFASTEDHRRRIIQMGEPPIAAFNVGALALDNIRTMTLLSPAAFEREYGVVCDARTLLVTFHPVTRHGDSRAELASLLEALDAYPEYSVLFTAPNIDAGGREVRHEIETWIEANTDRARMVPSLGPVGYLSAARNAALVIGNSSSGLIEVPGLGVPSVDVGTRQAGRVRPASVLHAAAERAAIVDAMHQAMSEVHRHSAATSRNPFGDGHAADRIVEVLADKELVRSLGKPQFCDLEFKEPCDVN